MPNFAAKATSFAVFRHATSAICVNVVYCAAMVLRGVVVCCTAMAIRGVVFGRTTMAIGGVIFFSLTATGIRGIIFRHSTLVVGIVVSCHTTPLIVICRTTMVMCSKHKNQPKEECVAKIGLMAAMDDGSVGGINPHKYQKLIYKIKLLLIVQLSLSVVPFNLSQIL
jgi:hypothetical protein